MIVNDKSRETGIRLDESDALTTEFMSYIKASVCSVLSSRKYFHCYPNYRAIRSEELQTF